MGRKLMYKIAFFIATMALIISCSKTTTTTDTVAAGKNLYFATGQCNSGSGITTLSTTMSSRMIAKVNISSKVTSVVFDLAGEYQGGFFAPETGAQSIVDNGSSLLLLTENATNMGDRKIFSVPKSTPFNTLIYASDVLALTQTASNITRAMTKDLDGTLLFSKTVSIEKIGTNTLRIPSGANSYVSNPVGTGAGAFICGTSTTFMSNIVSMPPYTGSSSGKIIYSHQGATTATNRIGIINKDGYSVIGDCYAGVQISTLALTNDTTLTGFVAFDATGSANPTSMVYIPDSVTPTQGKLLVSYSASLAANLNNNTTFNYGIVMYNVTETSATAATISGGTVLFRDASIGFGISAMTYDSANQTLYVATASQTGVADQTIAAYGYKIEKFTLDLTATLVPKLTLVRVNNKPFLDRNSFTKCITSMVVGD